MYWFTIVLTAIIFHRLSNAVLDVATVCHSNEACNCNNNNVSCTLYSQDPPFILPENISIVHFIDVPIKTINNSFSNERLQSITWVASQIQFVETLNYKDLEYLDLSKNNISKLSNDTFNNCPNLKYIDLSNNQLSILPDNLFLHSKMLETLKIENNIFFSISNNLLKETINLKTLSIGNPNLSIIHKDAMSKLEKLEYLNFENSGIENLNASSFGEHTYLTKILLNNCIKLKSIDNEVISSAPNIEVIELNNCSIINFLPSSIVSLKNLKHLQMYKTEIQPNCYNGWFSQWFNETTTVIDYTNYEHLIKIINKLDCPAKIYYISDATTLQLTKKGNINCMAYGNPLPAITWLVPGGLTFHKNKESDLNIMDHPNMHNWELHQIDSQSFFIDKNGSLHILRMLRNNVGNYTCFVSNKYGNDSKIVEVHLDSGVFFNIKINALLLGIASALGFLMLTILCCAFKLLLIRLVVTIVIKHNSKLY